MTTIGHTITGLAIGVAVAPRGLSRRGWVALLAVFGVLGNLPDVPLPRWGHDWYFLSHSLFVSLAFILASGGAAAPARARLGGWPVLLGAAGAWLSHLLLDSFYNHRRGVAMFWPFSEDRFALGLPWFANMHRPWLSEANLRIMAVELAAYLPLLMLAVGVRMLRRDRTPGD